MDENLKEKISRSDFVDLEKLLPRDRSGIGAITSNHDENKVELVTRDGHTYFKPVRNAQINGLRKWEQAFSIYAAIYTQANPERSVEIWQYMHVINVATLSYQWDNVASYDLTFRQLMVFKPQRSWAKTYTQGWNLALRDSIGRNTTTTFQKVLTFRDQVVELVELGMMTAVGDLIKIDARTLNASLITDAHIVVVGIMGF